MTRLGVWLSQAVAWFRKTAARGSATAQSKPESMHANGRRVQQNEAEDKSTLSSNEISGLFDEFLRDAIAALPDDAAAAVAWRKAADQGHADAQYYLGVMYATRKAVTEEDVPQDDVEAVKWFRLAADQGFAPAQYNLGHMYNTGQGVPQDFVEAVAWYRKAADQSDAPAQANLGNMYHTGRGVPQDDAQAVAWYRKAAEQGYVDAEYNLGNAYHSGQGVPQDDAKAVSWWRKAAEKGYSAAQDNLGATYELGKGVPQDYVEAHKWRNLAASCALVEDQPISVQSLDAVANLMTPAQIAEAQRRAREWQAAFDARQE